MLRAGLEDTAERVFVAMMQGQPEFEVTAQMKRTAAGLVFIRRNFDAERLAAEMLLVMLRESRAGPNWRSKHAPEEAVPRAMEMLTDSPKHPALSNKPALQAPHAEPIKGSTLPLPTALSTTSPPVTDLKAEMIARGRDAFVSGLSDTVARIFHAVLIEQEIDMAPEMKDIGLNVMMARKGVEDDQIVADIVEDMLCAHEPPIRCKFTAITGDPKASDR